jgi:hypothetical protein
MPKNEIDPEDPMELCGVALTTEEDTRDAMTECFIEEFLRLGFPAARILGLFRNPHYVGPNLVYQERGEAFVRDRITEVFGWWKQPVAWPAPDPNPDPPEDPNPLRDRDNGAPAAVPAGPASAPADACDAGSRSGELNLTHAPSQDDGGTDPCGGPAPTLRY